MFWSISSLVFKFQSTLPHGERQLTETFTSWQLNFNPRSHTGSDDTGRFCLQQGGNFNPRSHTGSDPLQFYPIHGQKMISIHAPTRGATNLDTAFINRSIIISIHAPTRGATLFISPAQKSACNFNPRSHTGSDLLTFGILSGFKISIHAPTRGATRWTAERWDCDTPFQSTLPHGERP